MSACHHCGHDNDAAARYCSSCGSVLTACANGSEERKTVTVVFCDLAQSTALGEQLDAESLGAVLNRFYERARRLLRAHSGVVQKYAGDAVMAMFGTPVLHEDDALRAVAAAVELRTSIAELNQELDAEWGVRIGIRIGVNTGEVVERMTPDHAMTVLGDPVNVAFRLQETAGTGEIVIGDATHRLVRRAVTAERVAGDLEVKGKAARVPAWRVRTLDADARLRRTGVRMVGRKLDLDLLHIWFRRALAERRCHLLTVLGDAGVGKTRLVEEFTTSIRARATVLNGRCRAYGEGITYWPISQAVREWAGIAPGEEAESAYAKLVGLLGEDSQITARVAQMLGLREGTVEREDAYWALQRMLELLARERPLVLVIDDLQHARPPLLALVQHIAVWSRNAPILLVCLARGGMLEASLSPTRSEGEAVGFTLSPLAGGEAEELVRSLLHGGAVPPALLDQLSLRTAGYPLYAEELISMLVDDGKLRLVGGVWEATTSLTIADLPPPIHVLLAARLGELPEPERRLLRRAAVVGTEFEVAAVTALLPEMAGAEAADVLMALLRKELIVEDVPGGSPRGEGRGRYRFRHALIREAAYQGTPKELRADLHQRHADWLSRHERAYADDADDDDEVLGYHLEQAYRHRIELGRTDQTTAELASKAGERLTQAGRRAALRGDIPTTAAELLGRAVALLPEGHPRRLEALLELADARRDAGDVDRAITTFLEAIEAAFGADDPRCRAHAVLGSLDALWFKGPVALLDGGERELAWAIEVLGRAGDHLGLAKALRVQAYAQFAMGKATEARAAAEQAIQAAREAGDERWEARVLRLYCCIVLFWGPTPLQDVIDATDEALHWARSKGMRTLESSALSILARAAAMQGRFREAREYNRLAASIPIELGELLTWAASLISEGLVELLAGDLGMAERVLRYGFERTDAAGGGGPLAMVAAMLSRVLLLQGRDDEAEEIAKVCDQVAVSTQRAMHIKAHTIKAIVLARRRQFAAAERLARRAVSLARGASELDARAEALADLAEVLRLSTRQDEARRIASEALELYTQKGHMVAAGRLRKQFALE